MEVPETATAIYRTASDRDLTFLAAGFAYYAFVSLIPLVLLALVVGSLLGGAVTLGVVAVINDALLGDPFAFPAGSLQYVAAGMVFGVIASLLAGIYPAWTAARERPVEALRG